MSLVSSGRASTASTIWLTVCAASGRPWSGQNGVPARAYSRAQVVVDLGHRAHGGARVVAGGLLLDGNRRRQALDQVHIGLVEPPEELPRIGRQALHIPPLALGIQRVERQAGLARARQPRDHHQLVARNVQVNVLEVVRARPPDADALLAQGAGEVGTVGRRGEFVGASHGQESGKETLHHRLRPARKGLVREWVAESGDSVPQACICVAPSVRAIFFYLCYIKFSRIFVPHFAPSCPAPPVRDCSGPPAAKPLSVHSSRQALPDAVSLKPAP